MHIGKVLWCGFCFFFLRNLSLVAVVDIKMHSFVVSFISTLLRRTGCVKGQRIALLFPQTTVLPVQTLSPVLGLRSLSGAGDRTRDAGRGCPAACPPGPVLGGPQLPHPCSSLPLLSAVNQNALKVTLFTACLPRIL